MAATPTKLMTFAEFERLPEAGGLAYYELHHGEVVQLTRPALNHQFVQKRLQILLDAAGGGGMAMVEVGLRILSEYEYRIADVAWSPKEHWDSMDPSGQFMGVPQLVIEVLSPSNNAAQMLDREQLCLENGAREFWVVNIERRMVRVSSREGRVMTYRPSQEILLFFDGPLAVDAIFA